MRFLSINPQPIEITVLILKPPLKTKDRACLSIYNAPTVKLSSFAALNA